ncbi:MAG: aminotransferase class I/II-fold pyridoxal phosphate-dependent enzyme [Synergistaceae bacterium]|jgi:aspartate/methionine/tyrosine aminotransferase|nr:aminotransferase class I/II-fold pyridoxal phosphate-dependent enzyme [Synergistaceae bacterium]
MRIRDFQLERYFAKYEFNAAHLLSPSDCETWSVEEILKLGGGSVEENFARLKDLRLCYTESRGNPELVDALDEIYGVGREGLLVGCPEELIFLFLNSFLEAGDGVVSISPAYQSLYELPRAIGCEVSFWSLRPSNGRWILDVDRLEFLLRSPRVRLLIVNFPHNPTGYMPTPDELRRIEDLAQERGIVVFSDEMYRGLEPMSLPTLAESENAVTLCGLSKGPGLPGLRLGWLASRRHDLIAAVGALKDYTTICNSAPGEFLGVTALRGLETLLERNRAILRANAALAERFFARRSDLVEWFPAAGGPTAFPRLLMGDVEEMCSRAVGEKKLMILPDSVFDVKDNRFRVGMGRKNFPQALSVFGEFLAGWTEN